jgi:hypothetical protein
MIDNPTDRAVLTELVAWLRDQRRPIASETLRSGATIIDRELLLCVDEGCPRHGTDHVCINKSSPWSRPCT